MNNTNPVISIVTPVFNMARFIRPCIESVLSQDYPHVQYLIIDAGSTDGTREIIAEYASRLHYWISEPDRGQSHALNKGFDHATGDILAWLNADEEYLPGALTRVAAAFAQNPRLDFLYGHRLNCDESGLPLREIKYITMHPRRYVLYFGRVLPTDASFWSRRVHTLTAPLDEDNFPHLCMDYDWFLRMSLHIRRWRHLPQPLSKFKQPPTRKTANADPDQINRLWRLARRRLAARHHLSPLHLFTGWLLTAFLARLKLRNFHLPHLRTAQKILNP